MPLADGVCCHKLGNRQSSQVTSLTPTIWYQKALFETLLVSVLVKRAEKVWCPQLSPAEASRMRSRTPWNLDSSENHLLSKAPAAQMILGGSAAGARPVVAAPVISESWARSKRDVMVCSKACREA